MRKLITEMLRPGALLALLLAFSLCGCGGSSTDVVSGGSTGAAAPTNARQLQLTLDFGAQPRVLGRLVSGATYRLTVGEFPALNILDQNEGSAAGTGPVSVTLDVNSSSSQLFVRLEVFDANGNVIGWFDKLAEGTNPNLTFDTMIAGVCPSLDQVFSQARLAFRQQPGNVPSGQALSFELVAFDAFGNVDGSANGNADLSVSAPVSLSSNQTALTSGSASPGDITATGAATGVTLTASLPNFNSATSFPFEVLAAEPDAPRLRFLEPLTTELPVLTPMLPSIQVEVVDSEGNRIETTGGTVTLSFNPDPAPGTALFTITTDQSAQIPTLTAPVINGVATFFNVAITKVGAYRLRASLSGFADGISPLVQVFAVGAGGGGGAAGARLVVILEGIIQTYLPLPDDAGDTVTTNFNPTDDNDTLGQSTVDDARNLIYVIDQEADEVMAITPFATSTNAAVNRRFGENTLRNLRGIAYDPVNDRIFVGHDPAAGGNDVVAVFNNASTRNGADEAPDFLLTFPEGNFQIMDLEFANDRLYASRDRVFGAGGSDGRIIVWDNPADTVAGREADRQFSAETLNAPRGLFFGNGRIYVVNRFATGIPSRHRLFGFDDDGFLNALDLTPAQDLQMPDNVGGGPFAVVVSGRIYVAWEGEGGDEIQVYNDVNAAGAPGTSFVLLPSDAMIYLDLDPNAI